MTRHGARWSRLSRPGRGNALASESLTALAHEVDRAGSAGWSALVITGSDGAFCTGMDLAELSDLGTAGVLAALERLNDLLDAIEACPVPVLAAVDGPAVAGGLELVLACDVVIATTRATFSDGHRRAGLVPGGGATYRLPERVGHSLAREMVLTAGWFPAGRLKDAGLVNDVVEPDDLVPRVDRLVEELGGGAGRTGVDGLLRLLRTGRRPGRAAREDELELVRDVLAATGRLGNHSDSNLD